MALYKIMRTSVIEGPPGAFPDDPMEPMLPEAMMAALNAATVEKQVTCNHLGRMPGMEHGHDLDDEDMQVFRDAAQGSPYKVVVCDEITGYQFAPTEVHCNTCQGPRRIHAEWGQVAIAAGNPWHEFAPCCSGQGGHHYNMPARG